MKNIIKKMYSKLTYYCPIIIKIIEYLYYYFNNIITKDSEYIKNVNEGEKILNLAINDEKYYYVITDKGIGDTVIVGRYAYYLKEKYKKDIAFIALNSHKDIIKQFPYVKKIIGLKRDELDKIVLYISRKNNYETEKYKYAFFKMKISKNGKRNWSSSQWNKKMFLSERYKKYVFDNAKEYDIQVKKNINTEKKNKILSDNDIKNKSILLIPYAYTVATISEEFWMNLAQRLKEKGYTVYTNIGNPNKEFPITDTHPLNLSLDNLFNISSHFDCIIALRCGLCEFLALSSPKMVVINDNEKNYDKWDDVNTFSKEKKITNVYMYNKNSEILIDEIEKKIGMV